jgi:hypothetical protein
MQLVHVFLFVFAVPGFELRVYTFSHSIRPFCVRYFRDRILLTICLGWLQTAILLISASWVARITGLSHQLLTQLIHVKVTEHGHLHTYLHPTQKTGNNPTLSSASSSTLSNKKGF